MDLDIFISSKNRWVYHLKEWVINNKMHFLTLKYNGRETTLQEYKEYFINKTSLLISMSDIEVLSDDLFNLTNIESLTIIDCPNLKSIPKEISKLKKLKKVLINKCGIISIPSEIFTLNNLESINFDGNKIQKISEEIGNFKNLEILNISNNSISSLPKSITNLTNLKCLSFDDNLVSHLKNKINGFLYFDVISLENTNLDMHSTEIIDLGDMKLFSFVGVSEKYVDISYTIDFYSREFMEVNYPV